jgi:hypothetical protein
MIVMSRLFAASALAVLVLPVAASADPGTKWGTAWLNARETRQDLRADHGIANGSLTNKEIARIEHREARLDAATDRALSDGDLSGREFLRLNHAYNHNSRFIRHQKHDGQVR